MHDLDQAIVPTGAHAKSTVHPMVAPRTPPSFAPRSVDEVDFGQTRAAVLAGLFGTPPAPVKVDRFVIIKPLGAGAMGRVYLAYDPRLDRKVALKLIPNGDPDEGAGAEQHLVREAQAMAQLSHPNVVGVFEVGLADDQIFIASEYVDGETLRQWLAPGRSRPEVIDVFIQAGRGLAAAHRANLIHRDFKPANVLVGNDGGVRVADFGLARSAPVSASGSSDSLSTSERRPGEQSPLATKQSAAKGTPAFMAPEAFDGGVSPRGDQFAFCVALYQALVGVRPFAGGTSEAMVACREQRFAVGPDARTLSGWPRAVVVQGLAHDPDDRHASMDVLVQALERDPWTRRRRWLFGAGLVGAGALLALGVSGTREPAAARGPQCTAATGAEFWGASKAAAIRGAIAEASGGSETAAADTTVEQLDRWADRWTAEHLDACEATHVRGEQSERMLDLRMQCLDRGRRRFSALVDVLSEADAAAARRAVSAVSGLPGVETCRDTAALSTDPLAEQRAAQPQRMKQIDELLAVAHAQESAGHGQRAHEAAQQADRLASEIAHTYLSATTQFRLGRTTRATGEYKAAAEILSRSYWLALESSNDSILAQAAVLLITTHGADLVDFEAAELWFPHARAAVRRVGLDSRVGGQLENNLGMTFQRNGAIGPATEHFEAALAIRRSVFGEQSLEVGLTLVNLGIVAVQRKDYDAAISALEAGIAIVEPMLGASHPNLVAAFSALAVVFGDRGDYAEAERIATRLVAAGRTTWGESHPSYATALTRLARPVARLGRTDEAVELYRQAIAIVADKLGPDHSNAGYHHNSLGIVLVNAGRLDEGEVELRHALRIWEAAFGPTDARVASVLAGLGDVALDRDDLQSAKDLHKRALAIWDPPGGPTNPDATGALTGLGIAERRGGNPADGRVLLERAVAGLLERDADPSQVCVAKFELARAHWELRQRARARELAQQCRDQLVDGAPAWAAKAKTIADWLETHGLEQQ